MNQRAQIADTITWVFATIVIIALLSVAFFVTSLVGNDKVFNDVPVKDALAAKSVSAFLLTEGDSGEIIFDEISDDVDLNDFNGKLSVKVLKYLYDKNYPRNIILAIPNSPSDFPSSIRSTYWTGTIGNCLGLQERFPLTGNKYLVLCLDK